MARAGRLCAGGCKRVMPPGRPMCAACKALREADRGTRQERRYGAQHDRVRAALVAKAAAAAKAGRPHLCRSCGQPLLIGQRWEAAHTVPLRVDPSSVADHLVHAEGTCNPRGLHPANLTTPSPNGKEQA